MFEELKNKAKSCKTYEEVDELLKSIEGVQQQQIKTNYC